MTQSRALLFVMIAGVFLACLSPLSWWHLGGGGVWSVRGVNGGFFATGDGYVAVGAAVAACALAYFGAVRRLNRTLAGVGICLVASLMLALLLRDIVQPPRSPLGFIPDTGGYHATTWLYLAAAVSLAMDYAGLLIIVGKARRRPTARPSSEDELAWA